MQLREFSEGPPAPGSESLPAPHSVGPPAPRQPFPQELLPPFAFPPKHGSQSVPCAAVSVTLGSVMRACACAWVLDSVSCVRVRVHLIVCIYTVRYIV